MSNVTDSLDRAADVKPGTQPVFAVASSDADEKKAWEVALATGESLGSVIDTKGPPRLFLHEDNQTPKCSIHYRGYRCWISGAHGAKEALEVLEEFSLADLPEKERWPTVQAAIDLALELREPNAPSLTLEERAERVEKKAKTATVRSSALPCMEGAAILGAGTAVVWCAQPSSAIVIDRGGTPAFAAWSMRPVYDIVRWVDEGTKIPNCAVFP